MQVDSTNTTPFCNDPNWLLPATLISIAALLINFFAFLFTLYKYHSLKKITKPSFTYFSFVNEEHFVVKIASGFSGAIPHPKFFISRLFLNKIPIKKVFLNSTLKEDLKDIPRFDSRVPRTTFKDEQLFWLIPPKDYEFSRAIYKIYVESKVGDSSHIYDRRYDNS